MRRNRLARTSQGNAIDVICSRGIFQPRLWALSDRQADGSATARRHSRAVGWEHGTLVKRTRQSVRRLACRVVLCPGSKFFRSLCRQPCTVLSMLCQEGQNCPTAVGCSVVAIGLLPAGPRKFGALFLVVSLPKRHRAGRRAVCCHGATSRKRFLDGHGFVWLCVEFGSVPGKPPHA